MAAARAHLLPAPSAPRRRASAGYEARCSDNRSASTASGILIVFLALTLAFHVGTGIFMGLNNFVMTFPATYPCVIYAHAFVHSHFQALFR